jgi:phage baseplate assembly protein V
MITALTRLLQPIRTRLDNMVARAVVQLVNDGTKLQVVQLSILDGETREGCERFQSYGLTSVPLDGAEAVVLFAGGRRDHGLVIAVDDRRYRLKGMQGGEVALYTDEGDRIHFKRGGTIEVKAATKVIVDAPMTELAQPAADAALKGTAFGTALSAFIAALNVYTAAIKTIADPPGTVTATFTAAASAFATATSSALSAKVKVG